MVRIKEVFELVKNLNGESVMLESEGGEGVYIADEYQLMLFNSQGVHRHRLSHKTFLVA